MARAGQRERDEGPRTQDNRRHAPGKPDDVRVPKGAWARCYGHPWWAVRNCYLKGGAWRNGLGKGFPLQGTFAEKVSLQRLKGRGQTVPGVTC